MMTILTAIIKAKRSTLGFCEEFCSKRLSFFTLMALPMCKSVFGLARNASKRIANMMTIGGVKFKIFNSVISSNSIYVVDNFALFEKSSKMLFHHKSLLGNITQTISCWMIGTVNFFVSIRYFPANVVGGFLSFLKFSFWGIVHSFMGKAHLFQSFFRKATPFAFIPRSLQRLPFMLARTATEPAFSNLCWYPKILFLTIMTNEFDHTTNYNTIQGIKQVEEVGK